MILVNDTQTGAKIMTLTRPNMASKRLFLLSSEDADIDRDRALTLRVSMVLLSSINQNFKCQALGFVLSNALFLKSSFKNFLNFSGDESTKQILWVDSL